MKPGWARADELSGVTGVPTPFIIAYEEPPTSDNLLLSPDDDEFKDFDFAPLRRTEPWDAILSEADSHYYGCEGYFQDFAEALKLYRDAARLGSPEAFERLGEIY